MEPSADRPVLSLADLEAFDPNAPSRGRERRFCCPLPGCADKRRDGRHRSLSVKVETGQWHCHRCGAGGVLRERWTPREPWFNARRASSRRAFALNQRGVAEVGDKPAGESRLGLSAHAAGWRLLFKGSPQVGDNPGGAYLVARGIPVEIARASGTRYVAAWPHWERSATGEWALRGTSRRVVFPVVDLAGELVAIQGRVIGADEYGPKMLTRGDLGAGVFRTSPQAARGSPLVIVEAPIDALSLAVAGVPTVALCGTSVPAWLPTVAAFRRVILAFDADTAGDNATAKAANEFRMLGCAVERWRPSRKDWNEVLLAFGTASLRDALRDDLERTRADTAQSQHGC